LQQKLGHKISSTNWNENSKRIFWADAITFFLEVLEILSKKDLLDTPIILLWNNGVFFENSVRILIKKNSRKFLSKVELQSIFFQLKEKPICLGDLADTRPPTLGLDQNTMQSKCSEACWAWLASTTITVCFASGSVALIWSWQS
jgi:hypothetical protein